MKVNSFTINVTSEDAQRMIAFYRDVLGLTPNPDVGEGAFQAGQTLFTVDGHSETKGPTAEPQRVLIDFFVDDVTAEQKRLEQGVTFIRKFGQEPWGGVISTFLDPDGNYCQLIEYKPQ